MKKPLPPVAAFYAAHSVAASETHLKMAAMQRAAGRADLARASERTALKRRVAAHQASDDIKLDHDYAEWAVEALIPK